MILTWDSFATDAKGHGGNHRSAQIRDLCESPDHRVGSLPKSAYSWRSLIRSIASAHKLLWSLPRHWKGPRSWMHATRLYAAILENQVDSIVCEKVYWSPWIVAFTKLFPTICVPQNIESLVPGQRNALARNDWDDIAQELRLLSRMKACFCICPEDAAILRSVQDHVDVLPYYPSSDFLPYLLEIREHRRQRASDSGAILILGTAGNLPTLAGMTELLVTLRHSYPKPSIPIIVAGHATDALKATFGDVCDIRGSVSQEDLRDLMIQAKCVLVNHTATTGCLTRVVDALIAGIPVLCNPYGMRGHSSQQGIVVFDSPHEGIARAIEGVFVMPPLPRRPIEAENRFRAYIQSLRLATDRSRFACP